MSVDLLRRAAAKMRERAEAAPKGEWVAMRTGRIGRRLPGGGIFEAVADVYPRGGSDSQRANAEHIASWTPAGALAVADLLDRSADDHDETPCPAVDAALAVARAYLGEQS